MNETPSPRLWKKRVKFLTVPALCVKGLVLARLIAGCSSGTPSAPEASQVDGGATASTYNGPMLTYYRDVKGIFDTKCADMCHYEGGIAPFSLKEYGGALEHKDAIAKATAEHVMPPWPPGHGCTDYSYDRSLTDEQITAIGNWVAGGANQGDPLDYAAPAPVNHGGLSRVDTTLKMKTSYMPTKTPDDYRCFILDWNQTTTKYVTGFGTRPGQPTIVHHALVYVASPDQVATYQAYDDAEAGPGYTCFGGPSGDPSAIDGGGGLNASSFPAQIGGWVPGVLGSDYPPNTGIKVEPGSKIILQLHYNTNASPPAPDTTELDMELADTVQKEARIIPWVSLQWLGGNMKIEPEDSDATYSFAYDALQGAAFASQGTITASKPLTVYSAALHMHLHGTHAQLSIEHADNSSECMLDIEKWNFHWQGGYGFAQPKTVSPGDKFNIECHWNNTDANQPTFDGVQQPAHELNWGEKTTDEMCIGFMYVTQ